MAPIFDYKGFSPSGKAVKGTVDADTAKSGRLKLKKQGITVTEIDEKSAGKSSGAKGSFSIPFLSGRVSQKHITLATRQLASLIKANVPLVEALNALVEQVNNDRLKVVFAQVRQDVNEGSSLAKALASHPKIFDNIFVNMVEAGESSGTLGLVLLRLAELKEAQLRLTSKVVSGMTYPAIMMVLGIVVVFVIFLYVIPNITKIFENSNKPLPLITKVMIMASKFFVSYWYIMFAVIGGSAFIFMRYIRSERGKPVWDRFRLSAPIFGELNRIVAVTRFASTLSVLLGSGVPIMTCMTIARNLVGNVHIERAIESARENISEGQTIAEPLKKSGQFPPLVIHMIMIREKTGELPQMLHSVATTYEEQTNATVERMTALLEPLMIVIMGGFVALVVLAVFIPMTEMSNIR